jgi:eukaryotic-like serine/threonine-protein kinase
MIPHEPTEHVESMPGIGDLIGGRYRLESVIGRGALGTVMRAQHITMGRQVAVKLLAPSISNHSTVRRRLIERVHQAQRLNHPNNCRLFDFGQAAGSLYIVMELLEGATLDTIIDRGAPYPVGWVVDIGLQILDGLGEAHDNNFVHRNLKPSNIFLLPRKRGGQQVKLLDYGLASSLDSLPGDDEDEREAEICGTAAYLAPETLVKQQSGKASDVYAVGLILIEMLTGQRVFRGGSLDQVLYRQIHTTVGLPSKLAWTSLGKVLLKSVSKHPNNRFQDADAFYEAIDEAAQSTAPYFRLDVGDIGVEDEQTPSESLARMMRNRRRRRDSDRDDDDEDTDESEPHSSTAAQWRRPTTVDEATRELTSSWSIPLAPPPKPIPTGIEPATGASRGRPEAPPRRRLAPQGQRAGQPREELDGASPRPTSQRTALAASPDEDEGDGRPRRATDRASAAVERLRRLWGMSTETVWRRAQYDWMARLSIGLVALIFSLAGVGLYLVVS